MSHNSPRSRRTKLDARQRPDVLWRDQMGSHQLKLEAVSPSKPVISGGSKLSKLVAESDAHLAAMRKIVQ